MDDHDAGPPFERWISHAEGNGEVDARSSVVGGDGARGAEPRLDEMGRKRD